MQCPNCHHSYKDTQVKCASCGQIYNRAALEGLDNLEYLLGWLDEHQDELGASGYRRLRQSTEQQLAELRQAVVAPAPRPAVTPAQPATPTRPVEQVVRDQALLTDVRDMLPSWLAAGAIQPASAERLGRYLADQALSLKDELAGRSAGATPPTSPADAFGLVLRSLPQWKQAGAIAQADQTALVTYLRNQRQSALAAGEATMAPSPALALAQPAAVAAGAAAMRAAPALPQRAPAPAPRPARPPREPLNWSSVWERGWRLVASGALLRGLLYLGALMIVASAVVLVVRFWNSFPGWLQLGFVAAVPMFFYAGGFVLRRLKIPVAGSVFTGIGALLVAVDLAAVYRLASLGRLIDLPDYWLGASIFCATLYLFTLYRARGEFFGYLTLIGMGNVAVALAVALRLSPEWWVAGGAASGLGMVGVAGALKDRGGHWPELARPARYLSQVVLPAAVFILAALALFAGPRDTWAVAATLALVAASYGGLAWRFTNILAEHIAVVCSAASVGFALDALGLPVEWLAGAFVALAAAYSGAGRWLDRRRWTLDRARRSPRWTWYAVAGLGAVLALSAGLDKLYSSTGPAMLGLLLLVALLAVWAWVFNRSFFAFAAAALFLAPFQRALDFAPLFSSQAEPLAYALLATGAYFPLGLALRRRRSNLGWAVLAVCYLAAVAVVLVTILVSLGWLGPHAPALDLAAFLVVLGLAVLSSTYLHQAFFAWAAAVVLPIAFWQMLNLMAVSAPYTAAAWVGLGLAGLLIERVLARATATSWLRAHVLPQQVMAAGACALGLGFTATATYAAFTGPAVVSPAVLGRSALDLYPAILAQGLSVAFVALAAFLHKSRWPVYAVPVLSFFPVTLVFIADSARLFGQPLTLAQYGLVWLGLALAHLLIAAMLDRSAERYAHGLYAGGYLLAVWAVGWSAADRPTLLVTLGASVLVALASQALAHAGLHRAFDDLLAWLWPQPEKLKTPLAYRGARAIFLFSAAYAFPVWLALLLTQMGLPLVWRGLALAALAPIYVAFGLLLRRARPEYAWPLYSAGYALSVIGVALTWGDEVVSLYALSVAAALYAASAFIFNQPLWLLLANSLAPVIALMALGVRGLDAATWRATAFMALAFFDVALAQLFKRGARPISANFAAVFLAPGYVLSGLSLVIAAGLALVPDFVPGWSALAVRWLVIGVFSAGVALYAFSAWRYRRVIFIYLAAWLAAVPYYLALTLLPIPGGWLGLGWLPLIVGYILGARAAFHRSPMPRAFLSHRAMPFYLLAYGLSVAMLAQSLATHLTAVLAYGAATAIYAGSALLYRKPAWLFPGLLAAHLCLLSVFALLPSTQPAYFVSEPMIVFTWLLAAAGFTLERLAQGRGERTLRARLSAPWAQPFLLIAAVDVVLWQVVAGASFETGLWVAVANALLMSVLAMLWLDAPLAHAALAWVVLGAIYALALGGVAIGSAESLAWLAVLGFVFYLAARLAGLVLQMRLGRLWEQPFARLAIVLAAGAAGGMLVAQPGSLLATAAVMGLAGAQALGEAYRLRRVRLGYAGVALVLAAWVLALLANNVAQPQWYAVPAGLYLVGVGTLERHIGRKPLAVAIEGLGLAVLLVTTFSQSLDGGLPGLPYFILLIVEGIAVIGWGALRRLRSPFFVGLAANVINVLAQLVLLFTGPSALVRWLIIGGTGLFIVVTAVFVELQRERLIARAQAWREALAAWD